MQKLAPNINKKKKFIFALISGVLFQTALSTIFMIGNFGVYFLSYIHYKYSWVNIQYGNVIMSLTILFMALFSPLSGYFEKKIGPQFTIIISSLIVEGSLIFFYFQRNLWLFYLCSFLAGLGAGISNGITVKNCCYYYPKKKAIITAIITASTVLTGGIFAVGGEKIINPNKEKIISKDEPYYNEKIANNSKNYFFLCFLGFPIFAILAVFFFYKYDISFELDESSEETENIIKQISDDTKNEQINESNINEEEGAYQEIIKSKIKSPLRQVLTTFRFWRNIIISSFMPLMIQFMLATFRAYCALLEVNGTLFSFITVIVVFSLTIASPIWAFFVDKFGFQPIMKIYGVGVISLSICSIFFINNKTIYIIQLFIYFPFYGAIITAVNPHMMEVYGMENYLVISGFVKGINQISNFLCSLVSVIISIYYKNASELATPYRIVSIAGSALTMIGMFFVFFENDSKFIYESEIDKEESKNEEDIKKESINL